MGVSDEAIKSRFSWSLATLCGYTIRPGVALLYADLRMTLSVLPAWLSGSDPLPIDFVLDKRLWTSWFPQFRCCGRCRYLEFMITNSRGWCWMERWNNYFEILSPAIVTKTHQADKLMNNLVFENNFMKPITKFYYEKIRSFLEFVTSVELHVSVLCLWFTVVLIIVTRVLLVEMTRTLRVYLEFRVMANASNYDQWP